MCWGQEMREQFKGEMELRANKLQKECSGRLSGAWLLLLSRGPMNRALGLKGDIDTDRDRDVDVDMDIDIAACINSGCLKSGGGVWG